MQAMNTPAAPVAAMPSAPAVWTPAHHFQAIHDPASFAWLDSLAPTVIADAPAVAKCFGMDVVYLTLDALRWFPNEMVLAIPFVEAPPLEYFLVCNSGGLRWWCFVVLRRQAEKATALVFDVDPSVLLIAGLGLRETHVGERGAVHRGRDFSYGPNAAVLCPADRKAVRYERLNPAMREYFRIEEVLDPAGMVNGQPTLADVLGTNSRPPQKAAMAVSIGTATLGLRMRVNEDDALMRYLDSLADGNGNGAGSVGGAL